MFKKNEDYNCLANHTHNFVDPDTGANTNNSERLWLDVRNMVRTMGGKVDYEKHFDKAVLKVLKCKNEKSPHRLEVRFKSLLLLDSK